ncbi:MULTISPECIES: M14 family zinc carboxypeptidase [unclassified Wenzhouxiangella]|uniref:M14 family zinc carboxypeptidase n=1 Tax=unclassified Wenzhouxiangella TaxID=2613841 RepID=UPI000E329716|nr:MULTISPECIES: M14 family zinc carboxypeptidase [unclassified Wenzhouxiangella]RFF26608.1 peptidase [Wenzhouxiangella sp. 15181]RFP67643.1 peptidase [Wenzhouxiangella sp. 15190]
MSRVLLLAVLLAPLALAETQTPYPEPTPSPLAGLDYPYSLFPDSADHDPAIPLPQSVLGFPVGQQVATSSQILEYARRVAEASNRVELVEYGETFEGRKLVYLAVSSPDNLARREEIQEGMAALADPRDSSTGEPERLIDELPAVGWFGYSIHGNESSGSDASLAVLYHLTADRSQATAELLEDLVVIIDPNMNPDGRMRFVNGVHQSRGEQPNVDDQSLVHSGYWPYGRGNHYLFDLNRDWLYARQPETRGRIPHVINWKPLLFVDIHEMGSQDTFLFSPPREPYNPHLPHQGSDMGNRFADDQAAAFDEFGYPYYSGEWNENWFPGYSDAWAALRGAHGILYEQARIADDGVQRPSHLLSYRQSVHHQVLSTFANLETLRENRREMLTAFAEDKAALVSGRGPYGERSFVFPPTANQGRMNELLGLLAIQEIETHRLTEDLRVSRVTDRLGRDRRGVTLPAGSIVIRNRQPEARLVAAMFEFDPHIGESALEAERESILKEGRSTLYDTTGWNIPMMFDLEALSVPEHLTRSIERIEPVRVKGDAGTADGAIALVASGDDDRSVALAARLMERGLNVRANTRESELEGVELPVGSIAVTRDDNRDLDDWQQQVVDAAGELGLAVEPVGHGRAPGEKADLGGGYWELLQQPKIALIGRGSSNMLDFGAAWYLLDHRLGIRHSHLDEGRLGGADLRRYNTLYLPDRRGGSLPDALAGELEAWVKAGGTLIAVGSAARGLTAGEEPLISVRTLSQVVEEDLGEYQDALYREWQARHDPLPDSIWSHAAEATALPWEGRDDSLPSADARKRRDDWQRLFMPSGALVAARNDEEHWLTAGTGEYLTGLFSDSPVLMSKPPVEAPLRMGVYTEADKNARLLGWSPVPEGRELRVRAGGLLWPEARERIANGAWVTRESVGDGQIILFAHPPAFRAAQIGAMRILENALILGPGLGADQPVTLP